MFIIFVYPFVTRKIMCLSLACSWGNKEFEWLCLGITNMSATRILAFGILSWPPSVAMVNAPVHHKQLLADSHLEQTQKLLNNLRICLLLKDNCGSLSFCQLNVLCLLHSCFSFLCFPYYFTLKLSVCYSFLSFIFPTFPLQILFFLCVFFLCKFYHCGVDIN